MTTEQINTIKTEYEPRVLSVLNRWRASFKAHGWDAGEPFDMHDECYSWGLAVYPNGETDDLQEPDDLIDVRFTIAESGPYAGDRNEAGDSEGINVLVDVVAWGGQIVGGFSPYNYTTRVWTDDPEEWADRFRAFERIDAEELIDSIESFRNDRPER